MEQQVQCGRCGNRTFHLIVQTQIVPSDEILEVSKLTVCGYKCNSCGNEIKANNL